MIADHSHRRPFSGAPADFWPNEVGFPLSRPGRPPLDRGLGDCGEIRHSRRSQGSCEDAARHSLSRCPGRHGRDRVAPGFRSVCLGRGHGPDEGCNLWYRDGVALRGTVLEAGHEVWAVDPWIAHVDAINASGLRLDGASCNRRIEGIRAVPDFAEVGECDLIVIATKMAGVGPRLARLRSIRRPGR